jgi:hypothetical protein
VLSEVSQLSFWWPEWGQRPEEASAAVAIAQARLAEVPPLVPLHAYRFISSMPELPGNPVLSVYGTDVICIARDLPDYFRREFHDGYAGQPPRNGRQIVFWSLLIESRGHRHV